MIRYFFIILFPTLCFHGISNAQIFQNIDSLRRICQSASNDSERVVASGVLADYYFTYQMDREGDSVLQNQLKIAELSNNKNLLLLACFGKAVMNISTWDKKESFDKTLQFLYKGLNYAKSNGWEDYIALSYIRIANINRKAGEINNSLEFALRANSSIQSIRNDSVKILAALEVGTCYQAKGSLTDAFNYYIKAIDEAVKIDNISLQSEAFHRLSDLYQLIDDYAKAKEYLLMSLEINKQHNIGEGLIKDYIDLARLTDERIYIERALSISDSLNLEYYYIQAKGVMYGYYTFIIADSDSTLNFINNNPDLKEIWINTGIPYYFMNMGSIYQYATKTNKKDSTNKLDSAIYFLKLSLQGYEKDNNEKNIQTLYSEIGKCYYDLRKYKEAIVFFKKAFAINSKINNIQNAAYYSFTLSELYKETGDFENAYFYSRQNAILQDSIHNRANNKDISRKELVIADIKHEKALELIAQERKEKRNIQYWVISISITLIFFLLIIIGMLTVSKIFIKLVGYIAFISLFEFIVLVIDSSILKHISNEEPLLFWIFKIFLIGMLVPLQHFLEHKLTRYLETSKNKNFFSFKKRRRHQKKVTKSSIENIEKDTAVL